MAILRSAGGERVDEPLADVDVARGRAVEPGDHSQQSRLAAARGADQHDELAIVDAEIDVYEDARRAVVLVQLVDTQIRHMLERPYLTAPAVSPAMS